MSVYGDSRYLHYVVTLTHGEVKCFKFQISAADGAGARNGIEKSAVVVRLPAAGGGCARRGI